MNENRSEDHVVAAASPGRGGVHAIADVLDELMEQYLAPFPEVTVVLPEEEALAV